MSGTATATSPIEVFISYAHRDTRFLESLHEHLSLLQRQGIITTWYDRNISAGREVTKEIEERLNAAGIILLLVSASFTASDYIHDIELKRAMERHETGETRVIRIILRPCEWKDTPFRTLKALPEDGRPVTKWTNRDEAFLEQGATALDALTRAYREAGSTLERILSSLAFIVAGQLPPEDHDLSTLRAELAKESYFDDHAIRQDIIDTLTATRLARAEIIPAAWRDIYSRDGD
jgi:hypothetical protein